MATFLEKTSVLGTSIHKEEIRKRRRTDHNTNELPTAFDDEYMPTDSNMPMIQCEVVNFTVVTFLRNKSK